jgi:hypothetical protein
MLGFVRPIQRAIALAESKLQRNLANAVKQEAKQFHATPVRANAVQVMKKLKPVHLEGLELVSHSYSQGVYGCV